MADFPTPDLVAGEMGETVPAQQAYLELVFTAQMLSQRMAELFEASGVSGKQYNVLRAVRRAGEHGLTPSQIHEQLVERGADVTRLVDRLKKMGLVERRHDDKDRRVVIVTLTDKGRGLLAGLDKPVIEAHRRQFEALSGDEMTTLIGLLRKTRGLPA